MRILEVKAESGPSQIIIGERLANLKKYIDPGNTIILTDENILKYYRDALPIGIPLIEMGLGEKNKSLSTLDRIMGRLMELEADRSSFLLAVGGGICANWNNLTKMYMLNIGVKTSYHPKEGSE